MEQLPRLKARIASLKELRNLVRAMRALAASHAQEAQSALGGIRRYVEVVEKAIAEGASLLDDAERLFARSTQAVGSLSIVVAGEHGFAGAFSRRLLDHAVAERKPGQELVVIGRRGAMLAEEMGLDVRQSFAMATHVGGVLGITRHIAAYLREVSTADVVFGSYQKGGSFEPRSKRLLPLDPALLEGREAANPPLHHLEPAALLQQLAEEYFFAELTRAIMESLASENGARLQAMSAADHNIGDKLDKLQRTELALRQESITSELLDVVTGSEAILADTGR
ncbi:MAG: FoF1 ATP synthase subunit gamma [Alphaproteobacteria bacterium]